MSDGLMIPRLSSAASSQLLLLLLLLLALLSMMPLAEEEGRLFIDTAEDGVRADLESSFLADRGELCFAN